MAAALTLLREAELEQLHDAALRILENFGVKVDDPAVRGLLRRHDCRVENDRVFFSRSLVAAAVAAARNRLAFRCCHSGREVTLEPGCVRTHSTGGVPWVIDPADGGRRSATSRDMTDALRLMNQLDEIDFPCCLFYPAGAPAAISQYLQTESMFRYCRKPVYAPGVSTAGNAKYIAELFRLFSPGDGAYAGLAGVSPESPLYLPREITDIMSILIAAGVPVAVLSAPMAGLTGPITLAGCVAQCHAEILAFAALAYLIRPQTPLVLSYRTFFCNMKRAQAILGLPENGVASAVCAQLAAHYGFLSDVYGLACTSFANDEQTGYEKMFNALLPALAGANLITGFGSLASVMGGSLSQLVLDNEMFGMVRRALRRPALDEEALGLAAVGSVALENASFLTEMHTLAHLRDPDGFAPRLGFDRMLGEEAAAEKTLLEKAADQAAALLEKDETIPLPQEVEKELAAIRKAAERELI